MGKSYIWLARADRVIGCAVACIVLGSATVSGCGDDASNGSDAGGLLDGTPAGSAQRAEGCRLFSEGPTAAVTAGDLDDNAAPVTAGTVTTVTLVPGRGLPTNVGWLDLGTIDATELFVFLGTDERPALFRVLTQVGPTVDEAPLSECPEQVARVLEYRSIDPNPGYKLSFQSTELETIDLLYIVGDGS